ncbi:hypothetical protein AVEN_40768-1 [Araneus ventricosus]|uniref:Integrase p58-like C-terminal domain-containing protein n=1 Tax=Araneus ventricosus TaxID=182803 RepID=A0A4Y2Q2G6_ARAVE|nr:hypothetical protein AVEN_156854-1 [Araneus ventricosus]GBN57462.1 hypothetical protein AVEN_40768-1 [Araneus ventricosus]
MDNPKRRRGLSPKLQQNWEGPYTIVKRLDDDVYTVQRSPNAKPNVFLINRLSPYRTNYHNSIYTRAFLDRIRNFESWSYDEDDACVSSRLSKIPRHSNVDLFKTYRFSL